MKNITTANQLRGRAIGSIFFAGFGALWILLSFYARQVLTVDTGIFVATVALALMAIALWLMRQARHYPLLPEDTARGRSFGRINVLQWIAVAIVAFSFAKLHMDAYVMSAITAIVGIHFFPLAKLFRYPMHNVTGAVLVLWASASVLFVPVDRLQGVSALGTGIVLWLSAAITLTLAIAMARRSHPIQKRDSLYA